MKRKIKICFVSILGYPLYNKRCERQFFGGGAAVQLYLLSKEFAKNKDFDVYVITGNYNLTENEIEFIDNINIYNIRPILRKPSYYFLSLINLFITLVKIKPDVVIQRAADKTTGVCAFYCKMFHKNFIYSIANITDVNGKAEMGFFGKFFRYGINNTSHVIAQNKEQILELEKNKKIKPKSVSLIKNSFEIRNKDFTIVKKSILWIARAINWKRPEIFLKLAEKFPNEEFIMICNKTDYKIHNIRYWKSIFNKALKISNLRFIEYVFFHEINHYYKKAKIYVNTSTYEGFPNTFIQAFINGAPVISLKVDPDNILTENKVGFCCNNNFDIMVLNLKNILENRDIYDSYSQNCYEYVEKYHNIKNNIKCWKNLIENNKKLK